MDLKTLLDTLRGAGHEMPGRCCGRFWLIKEPMIREAVTKLDGGDKRWNKEPVSETGWELNWETNAEYGDESKLYVGRFALRSMLDMSFVIASVGLGQGVELAKLARYQGQRFESATWLHEGRRMPKQEFQRAVEKELSGKDSEPCDLIYFKIYQN